MSSHLGPVVHAEELATSSGLSHDAVEDSNGVVGVDGAVDLEARASSGELVGHGHDLERVEVGG